MQIAIGFATCGRAEVLRAAVRYALQQTLAPARVIICYTKPEDITGLSSHRSVTTVLSAPGLPCQRNAILGMTGDCDAVIFFDDDFIASSGYLAAVAEAFARDGDIVAATGLPIADGARGPGIALDVAIGLIRDDSHAHAATFEAAPHGYGCNLAIRMATVQRHAMLFDERLPLYAWSEDVDFTHRIGRYGRIVKLHGARGVHLGIKSGRTSGRRLGYSQVANPIYLRGKGSYSWRRALGSVGRNLAANGVRALWPEPWVDRRGRLLGNAMAFRDLLRGRLAPERVLEF